MNSSDTLRGDAYIVASTIREHEHPAAKERVSLGDGYVFAFRQHNLEPLHMLDDEHPFQGSTLCEIDAAGNDLPGYMDIVHSPIPGMRGIQQPNSTIIVGIFVPFTSGKPAIAAHLRKRFGEATMLLAEKTPPSARIPYMHCGG